MSFFITKKLEPLCTHTIELRRDTGMQEIIYEIGVFFTDDQRAVRTGLDIKDGFIKATQEEKNIILVVTNIIENETLYQNLPLDEDEEPSK